MSMVPFDPLNMMLGPLGQSPFDPRYFNHIAPPRSAFTPMDVVEYEHGYELLADVPGMKPEEINVTLDDNTHVLTVRGDHQEIHEHTAGDVVRHERTRKAFTRTFELPDNAKFTDITARINNGILNVYVPKKEERKKVEPRKIDVKTHAGSVEIPTTHVHSQPQAQAQVDNGAKGKAKA